MRDININTKRKGYTNVINFKAASDGSHDADDQEWNAFKFYGQTDQEERGYKSPDKIDKAASERAARYIQSRRMGRRILTLLRETA